MDRTIEEPGGAAADRGTGPHGVGIAYHPLLHHALMAAPGSYDFVEFPVDRYLDEAQRALLDPRLARLRALVALKPCVWRSSQTGSNRHAAATSGRIGDLVRETGAVLWRDDASNAPAVDLGVPRVRTLPLAAAVDPDEPTVAELLREAWAIGVEIGAADLACDPDAVACALARLPAGRVVDVALDTQDGRAWPLLRAALSATGARRVVVRRMRRLFPLRELFADLDRARAALAQAPAPEGPREHHFDAGPTTGWDTPPVPAALNAEARRVWREGVAAVHTARQLAQWMERRPTGRIAR